MSTRPRPLPSSDTVMTALRDVDPAPAATLTPGQTERARLTLERVLATDPDAAASGPAARPAPSGRRRALRWATPAATALALGITLWPGSAGPRDLAFTSWTAVPQRVTLDAAGEASEYCRAHLGEHTDAATEAATRASRVAFAERRGEWTYVMLNGDNGFQGTCLTDSSFEEGMSGAVGTPLGYRPPGPRELVIGNCCGGGGTIKDGKKNYIGEVSGYAGTQVRAITAHTAAKGEVQATVADGSFAAWWPDNDSDTRRETSISFDVTFTDGTTKQLTLPTGR